MLEDRSAGFRNFLAQRGQVAELLAQNRRIQGFDVNALAQLGMNGQQGGQALQRCTGLAG